MGRRRPTKGQRARRCSARIDFGRAAAVDAQEVGGGRGIAQAGMTARGTVAALDLHIVFLFWKCTLRGIAHPQLFDRPFGHPVWATLVYQEHMKKSSVK